MKRAVMLCSLRISNFGPIKEDVLTLGPFTYLVGRNNAGKSHYLKAIQLLLAPKSPTQAEIEKLQHDKKQPIVIEGVFTGVEHFTHLVSASNHRTAIESAITQGQLTVVRQLDPAGDSVFGIRLPDATIANPSGLTNNLLKVVPEPIVISATADTADELKNTSSTALTRLKKEALVTFFEKLKEKTQESLGELNQFLHGENDGTRSEDLVTFETRLKGEFEGEFSNVIPTVEFGLPDEDVIAKEMKIFLDDGYKTEVEQKGHGLQRATLLALLKVLAKYGERYRERPTPIFLIGELESFLHPFAQRQYALVLERLSAQYQILTTTHSPFIVNPGTINGYRRVLKDRDKGTRALGPPGGEMDLDRLKRHLQKRPNLEGLFADRVILVEGDNDEESLRALQSVLNVQPDAGKYTLFVRAEGNSEARLCWSFYSQMRFRDVTAVFDLDYLFSADARYFLKDLGIDPNVIDSNRKHIGWDRKGDPSCKEVVELIAQKGEPTGLENFLSELRSRHVFVFRHGAPEMYFKNDYGNKRGWANLHSAEDLDHSEYLETFMKALLG